jgi:hypothetical protein
VLPGALGSAAQPRALSGVQQRYCLEQGSYMVFLDADDRLLPRGVKCVGVPRCPFEARLCASTAALGRKVTLLREIANASYLQPSLSRPPEP